MDYISKYFTRRIFGQFVTIVARKILIVVNFRPLWPNHGTYAIQLQYVYSMNISGSSIQANTSQIGSCLIRLRLYCIAIAGFKKMSIVKMWQYRTHCGKIEAIVIYFRPLCATSVHCGKFTIVASVNLRIYAAGDEERRLK